MIFSNAKKIIIGVLASFVGVMIVLGAQDSDPIPKELKLKVSDTRVVDSRDYIVKRNGQPDVIETKYLFFTDEIYPFQDGEEVSLRNNFMWTKTTGVGDSGEELGKPRLNKGGECFFEDGTESKYCVPKQLTSYPGGVLVKMIDGSWRVLGRGTTTKDAFDKQHTPSRFITAFLPGQTVFAGSTTTYPIDARYEDGWIQNEVVATGDWNTDRAATAGTAAVVATNNMQFDSECGLTCAARTTMNRAIIMFPTAPSLLPTDTVTAAVMSLYGNGCTKKDQPAGSQSFNIVSARNVAATTTLATGDFNAYQFLDPNAGQIFASSSVASYDCTDSVENTFTLDSDGRTFIEAAADVTGDDAGVLYFMFRSAMDATNFAPAAANDGMRAQAKTLEHTDGIAQFPKLVITATAAAGDVPLEEDEINIFE